MSGAYQPPMTLTPLQRLTSQISAIRAQVEQLAYEARQEWEECHVDDPDDQALMELGDGLEAVADALAQLEPEEPA